MKLKLTPEGHAVVKNGMPLYVHDDGREEPFDAAGAMKLLVSKHFATSEYAGSLKIPHEISAAAFGDSFRIKDGQLVAFGAGGGDIPMYSPTRYGEIANFDEALAGLVAAYPNKEMILPGEKPPAAAGAAQSQVGQSVTRAQFDSMPQETRARFLQSGGRIGDATDAAAPSKTAATPQHGKPSISRAQFDALPQSDRGAHFKAGGTVTD